MLVRRGVAGCILGLLVLLLLAVHATEGGLDVIETAGRTVLFGLAAIFLAWEAMLTMRKRPARANAGAANRSAASRPDKGPATVDDMVGMLGDTLKLARPAPAVARLEPVDVTEVLQDLLARMEALRVSLAGRPRVLRTLASRPALVRAFEILVENGLASGSRVVLSCDSGTFALAVHVDDDGPGIPKSVRAQVLEWQYYMATPPSRQVGCRAEVVLARQIARAHGGDILVGCSPLGGARFTMRLPLLAEDAPELAAAS